MGSGPTNPNNLTATTSAGFQAEKLTKYYEKRALSVLEPRLVYAPLGKETSIPKHTGDTVQWYRYAKHEPNINPLTEGNNPSNDDNPARPAVRIASTVVTARVKQYGEYGELSDMLSMTAIDDVGKSYAERFGRAGADLIEQLIVAELRDNAFQQYANDATSEATVDPTDVLSHKDIIKASVSMEQVFVGKHESGSYVAVLNAAAKFDILSDSQTGAWADINKRVGGPQKKLMNGEFGELYGARLLSSDRNRATSEALGTVRDNIVLGEEAFGTVTLGDRAIKIIMKSASSGGTENPLEMYSTIAYKLQAYAVKYLEANSKRAINIRAASAQDS